MDIGKKQQIMVDWFRKTLDESKKPWNTQVYLITDKYHVYIANKDIRLIGSNFGKAIDRPLKYFLFTDGKVQYFNSIEFLGYLPFELRTNTQSIANLSILGNTTTTVSMG